MSFFLVLFMIVATWVSGSEFSPLVAQINTKVTHPYQCPKGYSAGLIRENYKGNNRYTRCESKNKEFYQIRAIASPEGVLTGISMLSKTHECKSDSVSKLLAEMFSDLAKLGVKAQLNKNGKMLIVANTKGFAKSNKPSALAICDKDEPGLTIQIKKL